MVDMAVTVDVNHATCIEQNLFCPKIKAPRALLFMVPRPDLGRLTSSDANSFELASSNTLLPFCGPRDVGAGAA